MQVILIILLFAPILAATGQQGFREGFLLNEHLDTVQGLVRFSGKENVPKPCLFKSDRNGEVKEVFPGTVHGFCMDDGSYYYSRHIGNTADVFLEVLVKGYMNLFKFGDIYFVEKGDSVFFELSDQMEVIVSDGQRQEIRTRNFSRMLGLLASDCPSVAPQLKKVSLRDKPLVRLVTAYNLCKGSPYQAYRVKASRSR
jgi:hypothetical protein